MKFSAAVSPAAVLCARLLKRGAHSSARQRHGFTAKSMVLAVTIRFITAGEIRISTRSNNDEDHVPT